MSSPSPDLAAPPRGEVTEPGPPDAPELRALIGAAYAGHRDAPGPAQERWAADVDALGLTGRAHHVVQLRATVGAR